MAKKPSKYQQDLYNIYSNSSEYYKNTYGNKGNFSGGEDDNFSQTQFSWGVKKEKDLKDNFRKYNLKISNKRRLKAMSK